jgi:hypothetical protein
MIRRILLMAHATSGGETTLVSWHHSVIPAQLVTPASGATKLPSANDNCSSKASLSAAHIFDGIVVVVGKMQVSQSTGQVCGTEKI